MNFKDRLIKKILNVGKKHRLLVYPTLALVAVISAISNVIYWGRGNGKKLVASAMVVVMLITQSLFLTSSADAGDSTGGGGDAGSTYNSASPTDAVSAVNINYYRLEPDSSGALNVRTLAKTEQVNVDTDNKVTVPIHSASDMSGWIFGSDETQYVSFSGYFSDFSMSNSIGEGANRIDVTNNLVVDDGSSFPYIDIYFYATRTAYPVEIDLGAAFDYKDVKYCGIYSGRFDIPAGSQQTGNIYPEVEYTVGGASAYNAYRWGENFAGIRDGNKQYAIGDTITLGGENAKKLYSFTSAWNSMSFDISYVAIKLQGNDTDKDWPSALPCPETVKLYDGKNNIKTDSKDFGGSVSLYTDSNIWAGGEAYALSGWYEKAADTVYKGELSLSDLQNYHEADITLEKNIKDITLYAYWVYRNIELTYKDTGSSASVEVVLDETKQDVTVSGIYGDDIDFTISAQYLNGGSGSLFSYALDGDANTKLNQYGITVMEISDKNNVVTGYRVFGKLTKVAPEEGVEVSFTVTDSNVSYKDTQDGTVAKTTTHKIILKAGKKKVYIDKSTIKAPGSSEPPRKQYNGSDIISVDGTIQVTGKINDSDDVYVTCSTQATLDSADASDNPIGITLHNVALAGDDKGMYELVWKEDDDKDGKTMHVDSVAMVDRCNIEVEVKRADGTSDSIWFGQDNPEYYLEIVDAERLAGDESTPGSDEYDYVNADNKMSVINSLLGFNNQWLKGTSADTDAGWKTIPERSQFSPAGTYTVTPNFDKSKSNYEVKVKGSTTFEVVKDEAEKSVNYKYSSEKSTLSGYYPGLTITPCGGYTLIRLIGDGEKEVDASTSANNVTSMFKSEIKIDDCTNRTIRFQMLRVLEGGKGYSITTVAVDTVSVDSSVPTYISHTISGDVENLVNSKDFGTYYHMQNGIQSVALTFVYQSDYSACDKLYYYFLPEGSKTPGGEMWVNMSHVAGTNNYKGTISIGTANRGQLIVYAKNATGGVSSSKRIRIDSAEEFNLNTYEPNTGYYEWMVEDNPLTVGDIKVTDIKGNAASDPNAWYNGVKFSVSVKDDQSGIDKIEWKLIGAGNGDVSADYEDVFELKDVAAVQKSYGKVTGYTFKNSLGCIDDVTLKDKIAVGDYYISAIAYDNAGNATAIEQVGPFKLDCHAPTISDITKNSENQFTSNVVFEFTVVEADYESGLDKVVVYDITDDSEGVGEILLPVDGGNLYQVEVSKNSKYKVVATDKAGNDRIYEKEFTGISNVRPEKPIITISGTEGADGWYKEKQVAAHISATSVTSDGVPVSTQYKITYDDGDRYSGSVPTNQASDYELPITSDGVTKIEAWSTSEANLSSEMAVIQIKVDTNAPEIAFGESAINEYGKVVINYTVKDTTSGVDKVFVNGKSVSFTVDENGVVNSSFVVEEEKLYTISASDIAGNVSEGKGFKPLVLEATPITNIKPTSAHVEADIHEGTYIVDDYYVAYKKQGDKSYSTALVTTVDTDDGLHIDCDFVRLSPDTVYDYKIYAITKTSKEVRAVEGSFKTSSESSLASIKGAVVYSDTVSEDYDKYPIYVSLYDGNTFVAGDKIENENDKDYLFTNLADGTYRIVATDGLMSKTGKVVVEDGGIVIPENYLTGNGINFVLDGYSTTVVIEDNSISLSTDGLDKVFDSIAYYEGVVTREDKDAVVNGGSIEIALHAGYIDEEELSSEELDVFDENMSQSEHIQKYITIYVVKTVRDKNGDLVYDPQLVPMLYDDVSISFPLMELAGERVYVAMAHAEKSGGYSFRKWENEGEVSVTQNYVTISTNQFSTYALYIVDKPIETHIVKWIADGIVVKTEIIAHGSAATPPETEPIKSSDENYIYKFGGWSLSDYSSITEDTVISAWFTKIKKDTSTPDTTEAPSTEKTSTEKPTTEKPSTEKPTTEKPSTEKPSTEKPTTEKPSTENKTTTESDIEKEPVKDVYLGSDDSPKTGDELPIVLILVLMTTSLAGMVLIKKKN